MTVFQGVFGTGNHGGTPKTENTEYSPNYLDQQQETGETQGGHEVDGQEGIGFNPMEFGGDTGQVGGGQNSPFAGGGQMSPQQMMQMMMQMMMMMMQMMASMSGTPQQQQNPYGDQQGGGQGGGEQCGGGGDGAGAPPPPVQQPPVQQGQGGGGNAGGGQGGGDGINWGGGQGGGDKTEGAGGGKKTEGKGKTEGVDGAEGSKDTKEIEGYLNKLGCPEDKAPKIAEGVAKASEETGVDSKLICSVIAQETGGAGWDNSITSGLMQTDCNAEKFGKWTNSQEDINENIMGGAKELKRMLDMSGGDQRVATRGYNSGEECVKNGIAANESLWAGRTGFGNTPARGGVGDPEYADKIDEKLATIG